MLSFVISATNIFSYFYDPYGNDFDLWEGSTCLSFLYENGVSTLKISFKDPSKNMLMVKVLPPHKTNTQICVLFFLKNKTVLLRETARGGTARGITCPSVTYPGGGGYPFLVRGYPILARGTPS